MRDVANQEIIDMLARIRDAGGSMDVELFDVDLRAWLATIGLVNCTRDRKIELTELGKQKLKQGATS